MLLSPGSLTAPVVEVLGSLPRGVTFEVKSEEKQLTRRGGGGGAFRGELSGTGHSMGRRRDRKYYGTPEELSKDSTCFPPSA